MKPGPVVSVSGGKPGMGGRMNRRGVWASGACGALWCAFWCAVWSFGFAVGVSADDAFQLQAYDQPSSKSLIREDKTRLTVQVDPVNRRVVEELYSPNKILLWRLIRELDAAHQPIRGTKFDAQDQIVSRHVYYWIRGRLEEEEIFDARNTLLARMRYYYDSKGRPEKIEHYNGADALISVTRSSGGSVEPIRRELKNGGRPAPKTR